MTVEAKTPVLNNFEPSVNHGDRGDEIDRNESIIRERQDDRLSDHLMVAMDPNEAHAALIQQNISDLENLASNVCRDMNAIQLRMQSIRASRKIEARWKSENDKFLIQQAAATDAQGRIDPEDQNAHLSAGITLGLFCENVLTLGPFVSNALIGSSGIPISIKAKGQLDEGDKKTRIIMKMIENQIESSDWRREVDTAIQGERIASWVDGPPANLER